MNYERFVHDQQKIFVVDMRRELEKKFSELVDFCIKKTLDEKKKLAIILNKKGYAHGFICNDCGTIPFCDQCDIPIAYHKNLHGESFGLCHICKKQYQLPTQCQKCHQRAVREFGIGLQKLSELLKQHYHIHPLLVESDLVNSPTKIKKISQELHDSPIVIGTSLLAQPFFGLKWDYIVFWNADAGLSIPDYKVQQRHFEWLHDAFYHHPQSTFIVQTSNPEANSIYYAVRRDPESFWLQEKKFREHNHYPPYVDICVLLYKNEVEQTVFNKIHAVYQELLFLKEQSGNPTLEIFTTPPMIYKMFNKYRYNIIVKGENLKKFIDHAYFQLKLSQRGFKVDRQAESLI